MGDLPVGSGTLSEARVGAGYLSKYVAKTFTDPSARVLGLHRYDVAQGFQPQPIALSGECVPVSRMPAGGLPWSARCRPRDLETHYESVNRGYVAGVVDPEDGEFDRGESAQSVEDSVNRVGVDR